MKKALLFTLFLFGIVSFSLMAGTFRVNNTLTENAAAKIYADLQSAHDAAYNGDTLMIEGSVTSYNGFTSTKRLCIKGPGFFLDENPGVSANKVPAVVSYVSFNEGSSGSIIMGIVFNSSVTVYDNNITFRRCWLQYSLSVFSAENFVITECFFPEAVWASFTANAVTNLIVSNNIISCGITIAEGSTGVFLNNVLNTDIISIPTGFDMKNNILFKAGTENVSLPALPDPDVSYNISIGSHFGTLNHNKANASEESMFQGALSSSTDGKWQLKAGSPALGAGESGIDCGAFGGPQPYILSGLPVGPVIYELNVSSYSTTDNKLPVTIKVKSY